VVYLRLLLTVVGCSLLLGCNHSSGGGKKYRIVVIPKGTSHQFWKSVHAGALKAAEELGDVEIIWKGPLKENDTSGQIEVVKDFVTKKVDGICLAPNHSEALIDAVQEANAAGIPVVVFDSGLGEGGKIVSYVATDNFKGGALAARRMAEVLGGKGDVILLRYRAGSESTEQREEGFLETLRDEFPDINILSSDQYAEESASTAMRAASDLLTQYGDEVDGMFAVCEPNCNGTLEALIQSGKAGKVKFIAFDPSDALINGMKEKQGHVHGIVLQDPVHMGYTAVKTLVASLQGKQVEPRIATGEYVATPENMSTEQYDRLLNPILAD